MNKKSSSVIEEKLNSALVSRQKNNFRDAEKLYREVLEADSKNFEATFSLGTIFLQHEKFDEAREFFLKAILINPNHPNTYNNLGIAIKALKKLGIVQNINDDKLAINKKNDSIG